MAAFLLLFLPCRLTSSPPSRPTHPPKKKSFNHLFLYKVLLAPPPADGPALTRVGVDAFFFALPRRLAA